MEKLTDKDEICEKEQKKGGFFKNIGAKLVEAKSLAKKERVLIYDMLLFAVGFLFSRCHLAFGAYPLACAFASSLSFGVWSSLLGAVLGFLTLGRGGVIFIISAVITVFIRVIISGGGRAQDGGELFSENLLLRMCSGVIGGFVCAVYELLLYGLNENTVLYGIVMILVTPLLTFVFSGVFLGGYSVSALLFGSKNLLSLSGKSEKERYNIIFFEASAVVLIFFIARSLYDISILGVSFSYIFLSFATLLIAKRFGALRAMTAGFLGSLGVSGVFSVSFGLLGLAAGGLFGIGLGYGVIGAGVSAALWSIYSSGLIGFLSVLPEYTIAATLAVPILKRLSPESTVRENNTEESSAKDMIGTMALLYQKKYSDNLDALSVSLGDAAQLFRKEGERENLPSKEGMVKTVINAANEFCMVCPSAEYCRSENINPSVKKAQTLAEMLISGERPRASDINLDDEFCQYPDEIAAFIVRAAAKEEEENYRKKTLSDAESYEMFSMLLGQARAQDEAERTVNGFMSEKLASVIAEHGFENGACRVFGDRMLHLFIAGEDRDGDKITSEKMHRAAEDALGIRLSSIEYFRRESMVLMECSARERYTVEYSSAVMAQKEGECSGDTVGFFESENGYFHALISDGMGRGEEAARASELVLNFLRGMLGFGASYDTVMHLLNRALRCKGECSATVDLFALDRFSGEVTFLKSGAAPSYVKREDSIFRIRSKTAPLGLLSSIDTERIKVEVRPSDHIIMLSDGICQSAEESPWLLELLSKPAKENLREYAELILTEAKRNEGISDDMSVAVLRVKELI